MANNPRDFVFIKDVVTATLAENEIPDANGEILNIGCGQSVSINRLVEELNAVLCTSITPEYRPARPGDLRSSLADISNAKNRLGYVPAVNLASRLQQTANWLQGKSP